MAGYVMMVAVATIPFDIDANSSERSQAVGRTSGQA